MSISESELEILKQKIALAFTNVSYPKAEIAPHDCDECREVSRTFANQDWKTISSKILEENYGNISLLSSEAFHYFLPAFLIYSLNNFNDNFVCEFTIYSVSPSKKDIKERLDFWQYKFEHFSLEQINVVYEFLDLVEMKKDDYFHLLEKQIITGKEMLKKFIEPILKK